MAFQFFFYIYFLNNHIPVNVMRECWCHSEIISYFGDDQGQLNCLCSESSDLITGRCGVSIYELHFVEICQLSSAAVSSQRHTYSGLNVSLLFVLPLDGHRNSPQRSEKLFWGSSDINLDFQFQKFYLGFFFKCKHMLTAQQKANNIQAHKIICSKN